MLLYVLSQVFTMPRFAMLRLNNSIARMLSPVFCLFSASVTKTYDQFVMRQQFAELENRCDAGTANADTSTQGLNLTRNVRVLETPQRENATASQTLQRMFSNGPSAVQASQNKRPTERGARRLNGEHAEGQRGAFNDEENINENYEIHGNENIFEVLDTDDEVEVIDNERQIRSTKRTADGTTGKYYRNSLVIYFIFN